ncbi:MAG TPA: protein kinase [Trebonia sp.]|jgi:predicted Ser/Thr protein kinase
MPLQPGDPPQIGRYRILARLGSGGMGVVYLGQSADGQQVALKVLRPEFAGDPDFRARFRREVSAMARVRNRYTVQVLDAAPDSALPFLATRFAAGPSLDEYVKTHGPLDPGEVLMLASALAEALAAIHAAGVAHRDLKPSNVLLTDSGPVVIDFGIAQVTDSISITQTGLAVGSPGYMAPEQVTGRAGAEADIFTWALVVAYAASGQPPFGTGPTAAILHRITSSRPDVSAIPSQLRSLVKRAIAKDPQRRPAAADLLRELPPAAWAGAPSAPWPQAGVQAEAPWGVRDDQDRTAVHTRTLAAGPGPRTGWRPGPRAGTRPWWLVPAAVAAAVVVLAAAGVSLLSGGGSTSGTDPAASASTHPAAAATRSPAPVPFKTYSSATDAATSFRQSGQQFTISGAGADLWDGTDAYTTMYQPRAVGTTSTIETEVASQQNMFGDAKAGILVRNDMTGSGTTPEGVVLYASPGTGIQLEWDDGNGDTIDDNTPANGAYPELAPVWLKLVRNGSAYAGFYSFDGTDWLPVGTASVPDQVATQDAGMFVTSHTAGDPGQATFNGFTVSGGASAPVSAAVYPAPAATLATGAAVQPCATCYGGQKAGDIGNGGTLTFGNAGAPTAGTYRVTFVYCGGPPPGPGRQADISVNGGPAQVATFAPTGSFTTIGAVTLSLPLNAGTNTIGISNPSAFTPDFNEIIVAAAPANS